MFLPVRALTLCLGIALSAHVLAGDVRIRAAELSSGGGGSWSATVTLEHGDTGWDHYADAWRVVGEDGTVYGTRTLYHPHVTEQPFTRSLSGIAIPKATTRVFVEAHDKIHGWSPQRLEMDLSKATAGRVRVTN